MIPAERYFTPGCRVKILEDDDHTNINNLKKGTEGTLIEIGYITYIGNDYEINDVFELKVKWDDPDVAEDMYEYCQSEIEVIVPTTNSVNEPSVSIKSNDIKSWYSLDNCKTVWDLVNEQEDEKNEKRREFGHI